MDAELADEPLPPRARWHAWERLSLIAFAILPFVRAVLVEGRGWVPIGDNANLALRATDVGGPDTPLVGMPSGIVGFVSSTATHPGPLVFWVLAPWVRLLGLTPLSVLLGAAAVSAASAVALLWCARRLAGPSGTFAATVILVLVAALTPVSMAEPLNPVLALLPALVALVAAALVGVGEERGLPILVVAASFAVQADVVYVLTIAGVVVAAGLLRRRARRTGDLLPNGSHRASRTAAAVALAVCWVGPAIDAVANEGGNVRETMRSSAAADLQPQGWSATADAFRSVVDPTGWFSWVRPAPPPGSVAVAVSMLGAVLLSSVAVMGVRRDRRVALPLVTVGAVAAVVTAASQAMTPGPAGRDPLYLLPVLVTGAYCWLAFGTLTARQARLHRRRSVLVPAGLTCVGLLALGLIPLRLASEPAFAPGTEAAAALAEQAEGEVPRGRLLVLSSAGPTGSSVAKGIGLYLEQAGHEPCFTPDQRNYVGDARVCDEATDRYDRLLLTRPLGDPPERWRRVGSSGADAYTSADVEAVRREVVRSLRADGLRWTHQSSAFQVGQVLASSGAAPPELLLDPTGLTELGASFRSDPEALEGASDAVVASLADEGIVQLGGLDSDLRRRFQDALREDALQLWLVPSDR